MEVKRPVRIASGLTDSSSMYQPSSYEYRLTRDPVVQITSTLRSFSLTVSVRISTAPTPRGTFIWCSLRVSIFRLLAFRLELQLTVKRDLARVVVEHDLALGFVDLAEERVDFVEHRVRVPAGPGDDVLRRALAHAHFHEVGA